MSVFDNPGPLDGALLVTYQCADCKKKTTKIGQVLSTAAGPLFHGLLGTTKRDAATGTTGMRVRDGIVLSGREGPITEFTIQELLHMPTEHEVQSDSALQMSCPTHGDRPLPRSVIGAHAERARRSKPLRIFVGKNGEWHAIGRS